MRTGLVLVMCATATAAPVVTKPMKVAGYASFDIPHEQVSDLVGAIANLKSSVTRDEANYTFDIVDAANKVHPLSIQLPKALASPFVLGDQVTASIAATGGGPNARGSIAMTDASGLVVAIGKVPAGWTAGAGKKISETKGTTDDESSYAVKIATGAETVELVDAWAAFDLGKNRYVGNGNLGSRVLKVKTPPPDWVSGWTDLAIVRVPRPVAVAKPIKLAGDAAFPARDVAGGWAYSGTLADVATKTKGTQTTYALAIVDAAKASHALAIELPKALASPFTRGAQIKVELQLVGPRSLQRGSVAVSDDAGLVVAIGLLPPPWSERAGRVLSVIKGSQDDTTMARVKLTGPAGDEIELAEQWGAFSFGAQRFVGWGSSHQRTLTVQPVPPEWDPGWDSFAVVRVP